MATDITQIDISNNPELLRLAEEVKATHKPRILKRNSETVAMITPVKQAMKQSKSRTHYKAFLAVAGSLKGLIDAEKLKKDIYESRKITTRPLIRL